MSRARRSGPRWSDLAPRTRVAVVVLGIVPFQLAASKTVTPRPDVRALQQVGLGLAVQLDLTRRPADQIRGSRGRWRLTSLLNVAGPLAYFRFGRRSR